MTAVELMYSSRSHGDPTKAASVSECVYFVSGVAVYLCSARCVGFNLQTVRVRAPATVSLSL